MKPLYIALAALGAIAVTGLMQTTDDTINAVEQARYCQMVQLYRDTDGSYGWPDYDNRGCAGYGDTAAGSVGE